MTDKKLLPRKALNKAFLKVKPIRDNIETFNVNIIQLLDQINEAESEEFHKNLVADFLKNTYYSPSHFINTKGHNDLVIRNGKDATTSVGVILEAKKPTNKGEMLKVGNLNTKAFHELVLYFLRERITGNNLEIRYLIATNIYEWFIFDATVFEQMFVQNKALMKQFTDFEAGRLSSTKTDFFYKQVAEPAIALLKNEIESEWYFNQISTTTGMGTNRWKKYKVEIFPIKEPTEVEELSLEKLVDQILTAKISDPSADTTTLETKIDRLVYQLSRLTEAEIKIVEGETK